MDAIEHWLAEKQGELSGAQRAAIERLRAMTHEDLSPAFGRPVVVWIGEPELGVLRAMSQVFERRHRLSFPADLAITLSTMNGIALVASDGGASPRRVAAAEIVRAGGELSPACATEPLRIGGTAGGGLVLERDGVWWVTPSERRPVAATFAALVERWCDSGLSLARAIAR